MATRPADALGDSALTLARDAPAPVPGGRWQPVALYLVVPAVVCVYAALNNWKLLEEAGLAFTLGFYLAHMAVPWTITAALTHVMWQALGPWRPGLFVVTLAGSLAGCAATIPYVYAINQAFDYQDQIFDWSRIVVSAAKTFALWYGVNYLFDRFLGYPRYRYAPRATFPEAPSATAGPEPVTQDLLRPPFMARLKRPASLETLVAIHAEQHYINVMTKDGQELVLCRLSDAVSQLPDELGLQVHRSWWVSRQAIAGVTVTGKKMQLRLTTGLEVPVSAPYQALVRRVVPRYRT